MSREEMLRGYPTLTEEGLDAALDFAARQFQGEEVRVFANKEQLGKYLRKNCTTQII